MTSFLARIAVCLFLAMTFCAQAAAQAPHGPGATWQTLNQEA